MEDIKRIDLEAVAGARSVAVYPAPVESFEGAAMVVDGIAAICVNERQIPQRYRFTFAHELGHVFLPWHYNLLASGHQLVDKMVRLEGPAEGLEREANAFAAELLAPAGLVKPCLARGAMDIGKAIAIADRFDFSRTSAAVRMAQVTSEPMAVLLFRGARLHWRFQTEDFPYGVPPSGLQAPVASATADVVGGGEDVLEAVEVDGVGWFVDRRYGGTPVVLESSLRLGNTGDVLTILWSPE